MSIEYLFELGGENTNVARYEVETVLECEGYNPREVFNQHSAVTFNLSKSLNENTINRLGMTKRISKVIHSSNNKDINGLINQIKEIDIENKTFAIRMISKKMGDEREIAVKLGSKISSRNEIDLENPQVKILVFIGKRIMITLNNNEIRTSYKACLKNHVRYRPYFSPISIHPRIARAMINMSKCEDGDTIIDPFCGTGGILIEGGKVKLNLIGLDILERMVENTNGNLKHFGLEGEIEQGDVGRIAEFEFDAIVCDPPYGISTTTAGEEISDLMSRTMNAFSKSTEKGKRVVMAVSNPSIIPTESFTVVKTFEWYVHKSLTRNLLVLEKN